MARNGAIEIPIAADTSGVEKSVQNGLIKPIESAEKALDKLSRTDAGSDIDKEMGKAQRATQDLSKELDDTRADLKKVGYAARDAGDEGKAGLRKIGDSASEVSSELKANLGETFSSFRGDLQDLPQIAQDTLGGLAGSGALGGIPGLAATAAGAAGLGLIIGAIQTANEESVKAKERVADWAGAFIESGNTMLSAGILAARFQSIITDPEKFAEAEQNAKDWGVSIETAVGAMSGSEGAIKDVQSAVRILGDAMADTKGSEAAIDAYGNVNSKLLEQEQAYTAAKASIEKLTNEMDAGAKRTKLLSDFNYDLINSVSGATEEVDALGNKLYSLPDGTTVMVDADTGLASQNVDKFKGDLDGIKQPVTVPVLFTADASAVDRVRARLSKQIEVGLNVNVPRGVGSVIY